MITEEQERTARHLARHLTGYELTDYEIRGLPAASITFDTNWCSDCRLPKPVELPEGAIDMRNDHVYFVTAAVEFKKAWE